MYSADNIWGTTGDCEGLRQVWPVQHTFSSVVKWNAIWRSSAFIKPELLILRVVCEVLMCAVDWHLHGNSGGLCSVEHVYVVQMCPSCRCAFQQLKKKKKCCWNDFLSVLQFCTLCYINWRSVRLLYVYLSMFTSHYGGDHNIVQCHSLYWIIWSGLYKKNTT